MKTLHRDVPDVSRRPAERLRQLAITGIASVRYHSASSAEARFGSGHLLGAIEVTTLGQ